MFIFDAYEMISFVDGVQWHLTYIIFSADYMKILF